MHATLCLSRRSTGVLAALALSVGGPSCSFIVDPNESQCESNSDCSPFQGTICSPEKVCVEGCIDNDECASKQGEYFICSRVTAQCVNLASENCEVVNDGWRDDSAFLLGTILPLDGKDASLGNSIKQAVELAVSDFQDARTGLPPLGASTRPRPIVHVSCDDGGKPDGAIKAARHLASVGVPAAIGPTFSSLVTPAAIEASIPGGMLVISPTATSETITGLEDDGLVWRTSPSDAIQGEALSRYFTSKIVPELERFRGISLQELRIAVVHKGDAYGRGLANQFGTKADLARLGDRYLPFDYGGVSAADNKYSDAVDAVLTQRPQVIVLIGTSEAITEVLDGVLTRWPSEAPEPAIVISDGGIIPELWGVLRNHPRFRTSVVGSLPGSRSALFQAFVSKYKSQFGQGGGTSPEILGPAGAYDATYLLAYSASYPSGQQVTGATLAEGIARLIPPGESFPVGTTPINDVLTELSQGRQVDLTGASGRLDFDITTGEARSDILFVCVKDAFNGPGFSGVLFDSSSNELADLPADIECN